MSLARWLRQHDSEPAAVGRLAVLILKAP